MPLLQVFRDILLLRRGPQDLPYSRALLVYTVAVFACVIVAYNTLPPAADLSLLANVVEALVGIAFTLSVLYGFLQWRRLGNRFVQMATAFCGCHAVFLALGLPMKMSTPPAGTPPESVSPVWLFASLLGLGVVIWQLAVDVHIIRHSFDITRNTAIAIVLGWIVAFVLLALLVGAAP